ncbi:MAG: hypothetical protein Q8S73_38480 [Deltaproteobacteria bacterium]|nr:hypothetical protein [Myxococcales bacterium]MDP3220051.1 hypothetical protein [Deltaproteobacteria bacterium]
MSGAVDLVAVREALAGLDDDAVVHVVTGSVAVHIGAWELRAAINANARAAAAVIAADALRRELADARAECERLRAIVPHAAAVQRAAETLAAYLRADEAYDAVRATSEPRVCVEPADREARRELLRAAGQSVLDAEAAAKAAVGGLVSAIAGTAAGDWLRYRLDYDGTGP